MLFFTRFKSCLHTMAAKGQGFPFYLCPFCLSFSSLLLHSLWSKQLASLYQDLKSHIFRTIVHIYNCVKELKLFGHGFSHFIALIFYFVGALEMTASSTGHGSMRRKKRFTSFLPIVTFFYLLEVLQITFFLVCKRQLILNDVPIW